MPLPNAEKPKQKTIRRDSRQTSCTECHRRKQKCVSSRDGPCDHCARRFPPVLCIGRPLGDSRHEHGIGQRDDKIEANTELVPSTHVIHPRYLSDRKLLTKAGNSPYGMPRSFGGILTAVNCADIPSVDPSPRNTELFQFYCQVLAPTMASLDGKNTPSVLQTKILPWMMQSPLMPHIAIFTASGYRALTQGQELTKYPETIAIKGMILSSFSEYLNQDFHKIYEEAIQSVVHLALLEVNLIRRIIANEDKNNDLQWYIGDPASLWAHMKGLKRMLRLRGGIKELQNSKLRQLLVLSDYELSCSFERDLYIVRPQDSFIIPEIISHPESYSSPLFGSNDTKFQDIHMSLGLSLEVASILDDVRFLTTTICSCSIIENSLTDPKRSESSKLIQEIACRTRDNLHLLSIINPSDSPSTQAIYETIHLSATVYTSAIASRIPFSSAYTSEQRAKLYKNLWSVNLGSWKQIPGIFLWILFLACPGSGNDVQGRLLRRNASLTAVYLGFRALCLSHSCLRRLWGVQRWIASAENETDAEECT